MNLLRKILFPVAIVYWFVTYIRNKCFDWGLLKSKSYHLPIIAIGNLSVGGTGKTPHTEYLIRLLKSQYKLAVLSRGYKRQSRGFVLATKEVNASVLGDESFQIHEKFPAISVAVCEDRRTGIEALIQNVNPDVILLDDAFQHRKVKAGFYILLTAYDDLFVDDYILPFGNLRESAIGKKRANSVIITKCPEDLSREERLIIIKKIGVKVPIFFTSISYDNCVHGKDHSIVLNDFKNLEKMIVVGIAKPDYFIEKVKTDKDHIKIYSDHHNFTAAEIEELKEWSKSKPILTTEKDYVRLKDKIKSNLYYLPISVQFLEDENQFNQKIKNYVG